MSLQSTKKLRSNIRSGALKSTCASNYGLTNAQKIWNTTTTRKSLLCSILNKTKQNKKQNNPKYKLITFTFYVGVRAKCHPMRRIRDFFFMKPIYHNCRFHLGSLS